MAEQSFPLFSRMFLFLFSFSPFSPALLVSTADLFPHALYDLPWPSSPRALDPQHFTCPVTRKGRQLSAEHKAKISKAKKGSQLSAAHEEAISKGHEKRNLHTTVRGPACLSAD